MNGMLYMSVDKELENISSKRYTDSHFFNLDNSDEFSYLVLSFSIF